MKECMIFCLTLLVLDGTLADDLFSNASIAVTEEAANETGQEYLMQFGYMQKPVNTRARTGRLPDLESAIRQFQSFVGLPETGIMDAMTQEKMQSPRCGNKDITIKVNSRRKRRYVLNGSGWSKPMLTYQNKVGRTTTRIGAQALKATFRKAFDMWSSVANIRFTEKPHGTADILITFRRGSHGDGYPFDGPRKTLAHAFPPKYGGDIHFDNDEAWTLTYGAGVDLMVVAVHEIGHSLGLAHSENKHAVMAPFYTPYPPGTFTLHSDDKRGIVRLYGKPVPTTSTSTSTSTSNTRKTTTIKPPATQTTFKTQVFPTTARGTGPALLPTTILCYWGTSCRVRPRQSTSLTKQPTRATQTLTTPKTTAPKPKSNQGCSMTRIDAIMSPPGRYSYAFISQRGPGGDNYYVKLNEEGIEEGPRPIRSLLQNVNMVDAAMVATKNQDPPLIYVFTRWMVHKYNLDMTPLGGYTTIWQEFSGVYEGMIDAAFQWHGNNRIYLFSGRYYYKLRADFSVEVDYPKKITIWGLPRNIHRISGAMTWSVNNQLYFFVGDRYYKYDGVRGMLFDSLDLEDPYPRSTAKQWFGCAPAQLQTHLNPGLD